MLDNLTERQNLELASIIGFKQPHMKCVTCNHLIASSQPRIIRDDKYYHQNTKDCESNGVPGKRLKALRQKHKLSADILAHMLGKAKSYIYGLEKKVIDPNEYKKIKTLIQQRSKSGFARVNGRIPVTKEVRGPRPTYTPKQKEAIKAAGADLKAKRVAAGLTRANVAKFLKISPDRLEAWERGLGKAPDDMLEKALKHIENSQNPGPGIPAKAKMEFQGKGIVEVPMIKDKDPEVEALQNMVLNNLEFAVIEPIINATLAEDKSLLGLVKDSSTVEDADGRFLTFGSDVDLNGESMGLFTLSQDSAGGFRLTPRTSLLAEKEAEILELRREIDNLNADLDLAHNTYKKVIEDLQEELKQKDTILTGIQNLTGAFTNVGG